MADLGKLIPSRAHLAWPFFEPAHSDFARRLDAFVAGGGLADIDHADVDRTCATLARRLGASGLLDCAVAAEAGEAPPIASRHVCLARETLAFHDGLADFAFAMQGLGTGAIALAGSPELKSMVLPRARSGRWLSAFALSEKEAGSDVAAMQCTARLDGDTYVLDGEKTWISNGGIAHIYTVFARTGEAPGTRGISAFVVLKNDPGFSIAERIEVMAPHPLATIRFDGCRIPANRLLGAPGNGFKLAMQTLDIFRTSVAAAAVGFARRAFAEAVAHVRSRPMLGVTLADLQLTQAALGEMAVGIDAAALLTYRAAWQRDVEKRPTTREAAMAKLMATETAQTVIDRAVQLFGGRGVKTGEVVERLYREVRALRIYEGATEVQKLIIGRDVVRSG
jgi:acyl-CoA dehydrogenase